MYMKRSNVRRLESKVGLEVLSDLTDQTLEGELPDEELGRLNGRERARQVQSVKLDDEYSQVTETRLSELTFWCLLISRSRLSGGLGGELISGSLSSGRLSGGLLMSGREQGEERREEGGGRERRSAKGKTWRIQSRVRVKREGGSLPWFEP
jgi:hypothetical protein